MVVITLPTVILAGLLGSPLVVLVIRSLWQGEHRHYRHALTPSVASASQYRRPLFLTIAFTDPPDDPNASEMLPQSPSYTVQSDGIQQLQGTSELSPLMSENGSPAATAFYMMMPTLLHCLLWYTFLISAYTLMVLIGLQRNWRKTPKTLGDGFDDVQCIGLHGLTLLLLGVQQRLGRDQAVVFLPLVMYDLAIYALLFQFGPHVTIDRTDAGPLLYITAALVCVWMSLVFAHHVLVAWHQGPAFRRIYFGCLGLVLMFSVFGLALRKTKMHLHHYWWSWLIAHFFMFETRASLAAQAVCIALFIHGVALFDCARLFNSP